jgi:hypothetical protein
MAASTRSRSGAISGDIPYSGIFTRPYRLMLLIGLLFLLNAEHYAHFLRAPSWQGRLPHCAPSSGCHRGPDLGGPRRNPNNANWQFIGTRYSRA